MKIGLFIQSSNQELFVKNTKILMNYYNKIIQNKNYDISVYSYTSNSFQNDSFSINSNYIAIPCDDQDVATKTLKLMEIIENNLPKFDVIVKTNNSTIINLEKLLSFVNSPNYIDNTVYCCEEVADKNAFIENNTHSYYKPGFYRYPSGNFLIIPQKVFKILYSEYQNASDYLSNLYTVARSKTKYNTTNWCGVPEDAIWGYVMYYNNIKYIRIDNYIRMYDYVWWVSNIHNIENPFNTMVIIGKTNHDYNKRLEIEPNFIELICKFYMYGT